MIRDAASQNQVDAADPGYSTWVAANAGSGKTRVLTDRVARLLLKGVDPQNILCLTYTKAAAVEMQNRLFARLGAWAMMASDALKKELVLLGDSDRLNEDEISNARTLFARAIETPGGLKIQTIHSFCSSLLRQFPLEAGISPQFKEMDDQTAARLRADVLEELASTGDVAATKQMFRYFSGTDVDTLLEEITRNAASIGSDPTEDELRKMFNLGTKDSLDSLLENVFSDDQTHLLQQVVGTIATGSKTDIAAAKKIESLNFDDPSSGDLAILEGVFLFGGKTKAPFQAKIDNFPTKSVRAEHPELIGRLNNLMQLIEDSRPMRLGLLALAKTSAFYEFAMPFLHAYEARKLASSQLDFDDLIIKAKSLLDNPDVAQWVLYRLDGGIDHVLVDEAQDTSPVQWEVIEALTREFTAGEGARTQSQRTIFVVGDKQQSIYSFQGADPASFDLMQTHFRSALAGIGESLEDIKLSHSFRSSQAILRTVDDTFVGDRAKAIGKVQSHIAFNTAMPGRVDLWPVIEQVETEDPSDWTQPIDQVSQTHHTVQLAERIADQIKHIMDNERLPVRAEKPETYNNRPITPGDFLVLVQRRSNLFHEIIAACKRRKLPIAGADRLRIGAELAVKDLMALLSFLALPEDDLSLACALRSPIFGWSEKDLYQLAHHRTSKFLWPALRDSDATDTLNVIKDLRDRSDFLRPYEIIERILTRHDGRKSLVARLGPEAEDGIDALLSQALAYEAAEVPSLTGFITWMQASNLEIKRQMDSQGDQIRVMTVHGAKGLEAPIVILPDCAKRKIDLRAEVLSHDQKLIWKSRAEDSTETETRIKAELLKKQEEERLRLLYVAMTRAENWLIVAAAGDVSGDTWYNTIQQGMSHAGAIQADQAGIVIERVSHGDWQSGEQVEAEQVLTPALPPLNFSEIQPSHRVRSLSPSDLGGAKVLATEVTSTEIEDFSKERGTAVHLLLEKLPPIPSNHQLETAKALLCEFPLHEHFEPSLATDIITLIETPELSHIFSDDALAEVEVVAKVPGLEAPIFGTIDRLIVSPTSVLAVDFKSNQIVPDKASDTPEGLLRQMGAYAAALREIFPERTVETAILWTETGQLMTLPDEVVSMALSRVSAT